MTFMAMPVPHLSSSSTPSDRHARSGIGSAAPSAAPIAIIRTTRAGTGSPDVPPGPYTIAQLAQDALAILDAERIATAHVCGLSLGGITALWLAVHAPERVRSLTMANTGARIGSVEFWDARMALVRERGMTAVADVAIPNWFTEGFRAREPATVQPFRDDIESTPVEGYLGCSAAMRDEDLRESLHRRPLPGARDCRRLGPIDAARAAAVRARTAAGLAARHAAGRAHQQRRAGGGLQRRAADVPRRPCMTST